MSQITGTSAKKVQILSMSRIALVEDDPFVLDSVSGILRHLGREVWAFDEARSPWRDGTAARADLLIKPFLIPELRAAIGDLACPAPSP